MERLIKIRQRWRAAQALQVWRRLPADERDRLLGELEDMEREAQSTGCSAAGSVLAAAVDLLDNAAIDGSLGTWDEATADVDWLIKQVEALQSKR